METPSLISSGDIKQEPDFEGAGRNEANVVPIFLGKLKQELDDDINQGQGCSKDSSPRVRVAGRKKRHVPGRARAEKPGVCREYGEIYSCVHGFLPNSRVEYLQVMPGGRYLGLDKQDNLLDRLSSECSRSMVSNSVTTEGSCSNIDVSKGSHIESGLREGSLSIDFVAQHEITADRRNMQDTERPFTCDVCGVGFAWRSHLNRHKIIHTGVKAYKCDVCGVGFAQREHLKDHKRMHTGEKPFKCDMCGVGFTSCTSLKHHKRVHTGEKPYKCDVCGMKFAQNSNLTMHKRTHTGEKPYRCNVCGVGFSRCDHLKKHKRIHTGEKPYKCDVCGVGFAVCTTLKSHKRVHTKEKPYICDVCGAAFSKSGPLKNHKRIHTG